MEPIQKIFGRRSIVLILAIVLGVVGVFVGSRLLSSRETVAGAPQVYLAMKLLDDDGQPIDPKQTRFGSVESVSATTPTPTPRNLSSPAPAWMPTLTPTEPPEREASISVTRSPFLLSVEMRGGASLRRALTDGGNVSSFLQSPLVSGLGVELARVAGARAEDLKLSGVKGAFLKGVLSEIVDAGVIVHFDHTRGEKGIVADFDELRTPTTRSLLPLLLNTTTRRQYHLGGSRVLIYEVLLGGRRVFLARDGTRVSVALGLPVLLNFLEQAPQLRPSTIRPLTVSVRAEAILNRLMPVLFGSEHWQMAIDLGDSSGLSLPGTVRLDGGKIFERVTPALYDGVCASIPKDAMFAGAVALEVPPEMTLDSWNALARGGPVTDVPNREASTGVGVVLDLAASEDGLSQVGLVVTRPQGIESKLKRDDYFSPAMSTADCAGGAIWLASTSRTLLTRMKDSCERRSPSLLDASASCDGNGLLYVNPARGLTDVVVKGSALAGEERSGDTSSDPQWKKRYDAAVQQARKSAEESLSLLSPVVFQGSISAKGGSLAGAFLEVGVK